MRFTVKAFSAYDAASGLHSAFANVTARDETQAEQLAAPIIKTLMTRPVLYYTVTPR